MNFQPVSSFISLGEGSITQLTFSENDADAFVNYIHEASVGDGLRTKVKIPLGMTKVNFRCITHNKECVIYS